MEVLYDTCVIGHKNLGVCVCVIIIYVISIFGTSIDINVTSLPINNDVLISHVNYSCVHTISYLGVKL